MFPRHDDLNFKLFTARRAEAARAAHGVGKLVRRFELGGNIGGYNELRDSLARTYCLLRVRMVIKRNLYFAAVVAVDDADLVGGGEPFLVASPLRA